jgi:peptide methionine sulfoxide reductase MsrA
MHIIQSFVLPDFANARYSNDDTCRSGNDIGTQYRSFIGYTNPEQKVLAEAAVAAAQQRFSNPIVTQITEASQFYTADDQHQVRLQYCTHCCIIAA